MLYNRQKPIEAQHWLGDPQNRYSLDCMALRRLVLYCTRCKRKSRPLPHMHVLIQKRLKRPIKTAARNGLFLLLIIVYIRFIFHCIESSQKLAGAFENFMAVLFCTDSTPSTSLSTCSTRSNITTSTYCECMR